MRFFNRITLQTPESVELEFILAGIGNRSLALLIDYVVLGLILIGFLVVWGIFSIQLLNLANTSLDQWLLAIALLVSFLIYVGYFVFFETLWQGQTPGKRYTKIRVIQETGQLIGLSQATLRALLRGVDDLFFVGAFLIILSQREKRLGDWVAGTIVIQEEPVASTTFAISEPAQQLAEQLPQMANLSQLLPDDFAVIREYLQRRKVMEPRAQAKLSLQLARQVKAVIGLEEQPSNISPDTFLEAVYLAYQNYRF